MKTLPQFWLNPLYKKSIGTALIIGSCLSSALAQTTPLATPPSAQYPGIIQTFEKIIQVDNQKFKNKSDQLSKAGRNFTDASAVSSLELDPDFLNSIILHSNPGYIRLASTSKCRFYDTILTDLLKSAEGKIKNVLVSYLNRDGIRETALMNKKDFLNKVVTQECPETKKLIDQFQVKSLSATISGTLFEIPSGKEQCQNIHLSWVNNPKTPYLCQIVEYIKETKSGDVDPKELPQRQAMTRILEGKLNLIQRDYIENLCGNLDDEAAFCGEFLNVSYWSKIAGGLADKIYAEDICRTVSGSKAPSEAQMKQCLARLKKENDLCLFSGGRSQGLAPQMECDALSYALNHTTLRGNYRDCPANSDQYAATNLVRILLHKSKEEIKPFGGPCSSISAGESVLFNQKYDNDEIWKLEACYDDKLKEREVCFKTFFGDYAGHEYSYTSVVANILRETRGADRNVTCRMVDSADYNPLLLEYKSGCHIIYEREQCFLSECKHKIIYNDRPITFIKIKGALEMEYFPLSIPGERYSQNYVLTRNHKVEARSLNNLSSMRTFMKRKKNGLIHGVGCAENLLPSFFKIRGMNQCTPLPFIIGGMIQDKDNIAFVTHLAADTLQAPRLISWSNIFSSVKTYQRQHPLKLWTLYGLD